MILIKFKQGHTHYAKLTWKQPQAYCTPEYNTQKYVKIAGEKHKVNTLK